jgi:Ni/Co efflux regulator RcnB
MRTLIAFAVPAIAGLVMMAAPGTAAPVSLARPDVAPLGTQVQWGYGERREEYREPREYRREYRDDRRQWRDGDRDEWRGREYRRRMFCRMHPGECE